MARRKASLGWAAGTVMVCSAAGKAVPSVAMTMGAALWARKMAISLPTSSAVGPASPAAHTRMRGSEDRSMCFLSSVASQEIDL